jgi:hypothetical protein
VWGEEGEEARLLVVRYWQWDNQCR